MTLKEKLEALSDSLHGQQDTTLAYYVIEGARSVQHLIPDSLLYLFTGEANVPNDGLDIGPKFTYVLRDSVECRQIPARKRLLASKTGSIHQATADDPVYYVRNGKLYILPANGTTCTVDKVLEPTITDLSIDQTIGNFHSSVESIAMKIGASMVLRKVSREMQANALTEFNDIKALLSALTVQIDAITLTRVSSIALPTLSALESVSDPALLNVTLTKETLPAIQSITALDRPTNTDTLADPSITITVPTTTKPSDPIDEDFSGITIPNAPVVSFTPPTKPVMDAIAKDLAVGDSHLASGVDLSDVDLSDAIAALADAENFIGSLGATGNVTSGGNSEGAFWLMDEDPEMVQSSSQLSSESIKRANAHIQRVMSLVNTNLPIISEKLKEYQIDVQAAVQKLQAEVTAYKADMESQVSFASAEARNYETTVAGIRTNIEAKASSANAKAAIQNAKINAYVAELDSYAKKANVELGEYQQKVNAFQAKIGQYQADIQEYSQYLQYIAQQNQIALGHFREAVQQNVSDAQLELQQYETYESIKANKEIQQMVSQNQAKLQEFSQQVQAAVAEYNGAIQQNAAEFQGDFQKIQTKLGQAQTQLQAVQVVAYDNKSQLATAEANALYQQGLQELQMFIQSNTNIEMEKVDG